MFVFAIIVLLLAALAAVAAAFLPSVVSDRDGDLHPRRYATVAATALGLVALAFILGASISIVPTNNVGIVTQFNKQTGRTTGAGLQMHWPWQSIDDWDASGNTYAHLGDGCVWVSIAAQRKACIPVQIEWAAKPDRAPQTWASYKQVDDLSRFQVFVARRVDPQITAAITSVFANFDPLSSVDPKSGNAPAPNLNALYRQPLTDAVTAALGTDITIRSVAFEAPRYDEPTTRAIEAYGQKILEARNLAIEETNAATRKRISATNAAVNPVTRCLEIAEKHGREPGFCLGGGNPVQPPK